jgi:hypothetical protein
MLLYLSDIVIFNKKIKINVSNLLAWTKRVITSDVSYYMSLLVRK